MFDDSKIIAACSHRVAVAVSVIAKQPAKAQAIISSNLRAVSKTLDNIGNLHLDKEVEVQPLPSC